MEVNLKPNYKIPEDLYIPPNALKIFLEMFEGPLDLLLYLIRKQNLNITEIPLSQITAQYINYIEAMQELNLNLAGEYLLMAAYLCEIKSRFLLPKPQLEVEGEINDFKADLIKRLIEYEKIKLAAENLNKIPQPLRDYSYLDIWQPEKSATLIEVKPEDLVKAWQELLLRNLSHTNRPQIHRQKLSLREEMDKILIKLKTTLNKTLFFHELFNLELGIAYLVINFIAILELGKETLISLTMYENQIQISLVK